MRAVVVMALGLVVGCNEGHPELSGPSVGGVDAATPPDLAQPVVVVDMTPAKSCGQLAVCVLGCGQDLACYAGCGTGAPPSELIAAVSLGACAFASCIPRGDGGLGGIIGGGTGGGTGTGGGLGGINPLDLFMCLSSSCSMQLSMCDGLLSAFGGFGGPM